MSRSGVTTVSWTGFDVNCPDWAWRRDAVLTGQAALALQDLPATSDEAASRNGRNCYHGSYDGEEDELPFRKVVSPRPASCFRAARRGVSTLRRPAEPVAVGR